MAKIVTPAFRQPVEALERTASLIQLWPESKRQDFHQRVRDELGQGETAPLLEKSAGYQIFVVADHRGRVNICVELLDEYKNVIGGPYSMAIVPEVLESEMLNQRIH